MTTMEQYSADSRLELLKEQVNELTEEQLLDNIVEWEERWCLNMKGDRNIPLTLGFRQFFTEDQMSQDGLPTHIDLETVFEQHRRKQTGWSGLYHRAETLEISDKVTFDVNKVELKISDRINRLIDMSDDAFETVFRYARQYDRINNPTAVLAGSDNLHSLFIGSTIKLDEISSYQQLLLSMLNETYIKNLRRYKGQCCKQIVAPEGYNSKAWKPVMPVADFVYSVAQKETRFSVWSNLTAKGNSARDCIKHLSECKDMQFPEIVKDRHYWSFTNGVFASKILVTGTEREYKCEFYPYKSDEFRRLDPLIVSSKYFDKEFEDFSHKKDWWDIPTPQFQKILDYQGFSEDVSRWMYVMGGRLCFDVGELDSWQIIPFLKGIARSGKSTVITKVFKKFYESEDVRTLSNNIERKFGLGSIYDGFMFIAPEVKGDLCLEQAEFQSLVSGEDLSLAIKHEKAKSLEWKTPGVLGGNEVPNWKDNSGSVLRRMLPWNFGKQVKDADPHLDEKLDAELPVILLKCIRAYLEYSYKYSKKDIWNVVPKYFKTIQTQVAMVTNSLQNFLASEKIKIGKDLFVPQKVFVRILQQHCTENNLGKPRFNQDFYAGPFSSHDLEVVTESRTYNGEAQPMQPFIRGVDVVIDDAFPMISRDI